MVTKLVGSIEALARSRLVTINVDATLVEAARLLSDTQISLVVVCSPGGAMAGVITKTDVVRRIGHCRGSSCTTAVADVMTHDVASCRVTDCLGDVLLTMEKRGFVHVPLVDGKAIPLGVLNARDALRVLLADEKYEESLLRDYVMGIGYR